jgi:tetratricopeptide (TPR) repeat protein
MRNYPTKVAVGLAVLFISSLPATRATAQQAAAPAGQATAQPTYTLPEYNAEQAAAAEKDPQQQIKLLDAFVAQYPNSTLMQYIYQFYYTAYYKLKNYQKAVEYADKLIAMPPDKADLNVRVSAIQARIQLFGLAFPKPTNDDWTKERDVAKTGVKIFPDLLHLNPPPVTQDQLNASLAYLQGAIGSADFGLKDFPGAIEAYKAAIVTNPKDPQTPVSYYRLGIAYLTTAPPQFLDGFWALARAVDLKVSDSDKVKDYLRSRILQYEQPGCDSQVDAQLSELLQLAQNSPDRPASYTIPSHDDLQKISTSSTIITVINDLSGGGDKAKMTWLAICGAEFPEVVGKIVDIQKSDNFIDFMVFTSDNGDQMQNATTANMDVKVWTAAKPAGSAPPPAGTTDPGPQPDVARFEKDDPIKFSGAIVAYDPSPFLLHWDTVKVDPSTIPEKGAPKKPTGHRAAPKE